MTVNVFLNFGGMFLRLPLDRLLKPWTYITSGFNLGADHLTLEGGGG